MYSPMIINFFHLRILLVGEFIVNTCRQNDFFETKGSTPVQRHERMLRLGRSIYRIVSYVPNKPGIYAVRLRCWCARRHPE